MVTPTTAMTGKSILDLRKYVDAKEELAQSTKEQQQRKDRPRLLRLSSNLLEDLQPKNTLHPRLRLGSKVLEDIPPTKDLSSPLILELSIFREL